jgi:hypothetical protein
LQEFPDYFCIKYLFKICFDKKNYYLCQSILLITILNIMRMKRFFTFLFIAFSSVSFLSAQVTLTKASHGFTSGQNHKCQEVEYQAPGNAGTNLVWNFSQVVFAAKAPASDSNIEENFDGGNIKAVRDDGCTFFFNVTERGNEYVGYQAGNTTFRLTEPIVKTKYPQTFNTQFEGKFYGTITTEGSDNVRRVEGSYSTHADALGTIILPEGVSFPALRVRTTEVRGTYELVKYLWYAQEVRYPIFVTIEEYGIGDNGAKTLRSGNSFLNIEINETTKSTTGIPDLTAAAYKVFPNPFKDVIQLRYSLPEKTNVTIALYSSNGTKLTTLVSGKAQSGDNFVSQNVAKYTASPGIYLLKIQLGDKVYNEKLVKAY